MNKKVKLGIIIISYNRVKSLQRIINCLIQQSSNFSAETIIIDNASDKNTQNYIEQLPSHFTKILNTKNLGWAAAVNQGINFHIKNNCNFFLICNDDVYFDNNNLMEKIVTFMQNEQHQHIGIAGVEIISNYGNKIFNVLGRNIFSEKLSKKLKFNYQKIIYQNQNPKLQYVDFTDGCFMIIRPEVIKKIGAMDESFFMYWEEADFCLRAWNNGLACAVFPELSIYHNPEINYIDNAFTLYWKSRNFILYLKKNKFWSITTFWLCIYYQMIKTYKIIIKKKEYKGNIFYLWFNLWQGTISGLLKKIEK